jgi:hypothetical protein
VKNFVRTSLFIGARGVVLRNCLDMTVASFPEDDVPRVTFFTKIQKFSWKRIVGVNPLPRRASVGEFGKMLTPSKRRTRQN